ncbi:MAG: 6-bladed beta-propeller [Lachnoclostridium sp.]|jgi:hypothetical protein|nr:6-bladed beta-propeller [Lachnoclostridium sp.]
MRQSSGFFCITITILVTLNIFSLFFLACSKPNDSRVVVVDVDPQRITPDSVVFANREIVILGTAPEALLSEILAIDIHDDYIYVVDNFRTTVFVFSRNGEFLTKIGRQGRGPGEYVNILAFCIDRDNDEMLIATDRPNKLLYYSLSGKFLGETKTDDLLFEITAGGNTIVCRILDENNDMAIYETNDHVVTSVKHPEMPELQMDRLNLISPVGRKLLGSKHGILFTRTFDNTIYKVEGDNLAPFVTLDFGKYWQRDANLLSMEEVSRNSGENRGIYAITNARLLSRDKVIFNGFPNGVFIVDGDDATHYGEIKSELSLFGKKDMLPILDPETDYVAFQYRALDFSHLSAKEDRSGYTDEMVRLAALTEDDNPVIFLYKMK